LLFRSQKPLGLPQRLFYCQSSMKINELGLGANFLARNA
jgi:hypothetical protein